MAKYSKMSSYYYHSTSEITRPTRAEIQRAERHERIVQTLKYGALFASALNLLALSLALWMSFC